jgi:hypothetical protein
MNTPAVSDAPQREAVYHRIEQLMQDAAEAERAAFVAWQEAYGPNDDPDRHPSATRSGVDRQSGESADFDRWAGQVAPCGHCSHPMILFTPSTC